MATLPEAPINQASEDWAATKTAGRFFQNERATSGAIIEPHLNRTFRIRPAVSILQLRLRGWQSTLEEESRDAAEARNKGHVALSAWFSAYE